MVQSLSLCSYQKLKERWGTIDKQILIQPNNRDRLPASVESKRLHYGANNPLAKGHDRYDKHTRDQESAIDRYAAEGPGVDLAPDEEERVRRQGGMNDERAEEIIAARERKET